MCKCRPKSDLGNSSTPPAAADFTASTFFAFSRIAADAAPGGEIELRGHESKTMTLVPRTDPTSRTAAHLAHTQMGMSDEIINRLTRS